MVDIARRTTLERAFERAVGRMLPPGWAMAVRSGDGSAGVRTDAYVDLTAPTGERTTACVEFKARAEPAEVVRLVPWLQRCGAGVLVAPVIGARAREILAGAGVSWIEPDGDCRIVLRRACSSSGWAAGRRAAKPMHRAPGMSPTCSRAPPCASSGGC